MEFLIFYISVGGMMVLFPLHSSKIIKWFFRLNPLVSDNSFIFTRGFVVIVGIWFIVSGSMLVYLFTLAP